MSKIRFNTILLIFIFLSTFFIRLEVYPARIKTKTSRGEEVKRFGLVRVGKCEEYWMEKDIARMDDKDIKWYLYAGNKCKDSMMLETRAIKVIHAQNVTARTGDFFNLQGEIVLGKDRKEIMVIMKLQYQKKAHFRWKLVRH